MDKFFITFAGVVGCSKSPVANYLSGKLNLPVLNNDSIRTEVIEDLGEFNEKEYIKRRDERAKSIIKNGVSFIYDASVDREWDLGYQWLKEADYKWFVISFDLSENFLIKLYKAKKYHESLTRLEQLITDHQKFIVKHKTEVGVHISDAQFIDRMEVAYQAAKEFIGRLTGT
jgi:hypothetical protein